MDVMRDNSGICEVNGRPEACFQKIFLSYQLVDQLPMVWFTWKH